MNTVAGKKISRDYNFVGEARVLQNGTPIGEPFEGGTVPDPTTFEDTVTHEGVVTHEVAPVLEAGAQVDGPIYTVAGGDVGTVSFTGNIAQEVITGSGALDTGAYNHLIDTTAEALALTLGAPTMPYQKKVIQFIVDGGGGTNDATLTFNGTATIVFANLGDYCELEHNGADWVPVRLVNLVDGSIPVYTPAA